MILFTVLASIITRGLRIRILHFTLHIPVISINFISQRGINNFVSFENGGVTDMNSLELSKTREVPVNLGSLNSAIQCT